MDSVETALPALGLTKRGRQWYNATVKLLHRHDLPADSMYSEGRLTTCGRIEPHKVAFEDAEKTIWHSVDGGFMGLTVNGCGAILGNTIDEVLRLAASMSDLFRVSPN